MSESHIKRTLSPPPPLLQAWQEGVPVRRLRLFVVCFAAGWVALGCADWFMRFHWFEWQRNFLLPVDPPASASVQSLARSVTHEARRGGDLSNLIGIPDVARKYEEERPGAVREMDRYGFRNKEPLAERYDIVVIGDSYAATGPRDEDTFPVQLARAMGRSVYNHATEGRGTFWATVRFFASEHFIGREPQFLVWPVIERELDGTYYQGGLYRVLERAAPMATNAVARKRGRVEWNLLTPSALHASLPNSSAFGSLAARVWNRVRYAVFGLLNPAVVPSVAGEPMLFYGEAVAAQKWDARKRDVPRIVHALSNMAAVASSRGMTLVMVLVPDKECVHAAGLPPYASRGIRPCVLPELEAALRKAGVTVVNLQPAFSAAAHDGELLYWRDDTHWNPAGARRAAGVTADVLSQQGRSK